MLLLPVLLEIRGCVAAADLAHHAQKQSSPTLLVPSLLLHSVVRHGFTPDKPVPSCCTWRGELWTHLLESPAPCPRVPSCVPQPSLCSPPSHPQKPLFFVLPRVPCLLPMVSSLELTFSASSTHPFLHPNSSQINKWSPIAFPSRTPALSHPYSGSVTSGAAAA